MDFVTRLPLSSDWKGDSYKSILVIVDQLTKMVHYELVIITINAPGLGEVIRDVVVWHHGLPNSIITNRGSFLLQNSGYRSVTSLASNGSSQPRSTLRQTIKPRGKIAP